MSRITQATLLATLIIGAVASPTVQKIGAAVANVAHRLGSGERDLGNSYCPGYCRRQLEMKRLLGDAYYKKDNKNKKNECICPIDPETDPPTPSPSAIGTTISVKSKEDTSEPTPSPTPSPTQSCNCITGSEQACFRPECKCYCVTGHEYGCRDPECECYCVTGSEPGCFVPDCFTRESSPSYDGYVYGYGGYGGYGGTSKSSKSSKTSSSSKGKSSKGGYGGYGGYGYGGYGGYGGYYMPENSGSDCPHGDPSCCDYRTDPYCCRPGDSMCCDPHYDAYCCPYWDPSCRTEEPTPSPTREAARPRPRPAPRPRPRPRPRPAPRPAPVTEPVTVKSQATVTVEVSSASDPSYPSDPSSDTYRKKNVDSYRKKNEYSSQDTNVGVGARTNSYADGGQSRNLGWLYSFAAACVATIVASVLIHKKVKQNERADDDKSHPLNGSVMRRSEGDEAHGSVDGSVRSIYSGSAISSTGRPDQQDIRGYL